MFSLDAVLTLGLVRDLAGRNWSLDCCESSGVILYGVQRYPAVRIESVSTRKQRATPVSPVSCVPGR